MHAIAELQRLVREFEDVIEELQAAPPLALDPTPKTAPRLAIIVGHTAAAPGAHGKAPVDSYEYPWNRAFAGRLVLACEDAGLEAKVFLRDRVGISGAYRAARDWGAEAAVELHFNAAGSAVAYGTETLHGERDDSRALAARVQVAMCAALDREGRGDRGIKLRRPGERGGRNLAQIDRPSILIEPFFGSNAADCALATQRRDDLARAIAGAIADFLSPNV